jgi:hypothetical protein
LNRLLVGAKTDQQSAEARRQATQRLPDVIKKELSAHDVIELGLLLLEITAAIIKCQVRNADVSFPIIHPCCMLLPIFHCW